MGNSGQNIHIASLLAWIALHWNMEKIRGSDQQYQHQQKMGDATIPLISSEYQYQYQYQLA